MTADDMRRQLAPYLVPCPGLRSIEISEALLGRLNLYLELLLRWNEKMNLTAVRRPEAIVSRHFGESLLLGRLVPLGTETVLDLGSGAGFPGVPLQLCCPEVAVTLAESQTRKAAFLREVCRHLGLSTVVWSGRAEAQVGQHRYDVVAMRAVDEMDSAVRVAPQLGSRLLLLAARADLEKWGVTLERYVPVPGTSNSVAALSATAQ